MDYSHEAKPDRYEIFSVLYKISPSSQYNRSALKCVANVL